VQLLAAKSILQDFEHDPNQGASHEESVDASDAVATLDEALDMIEGIRTQYSEPNHP
jgi:hypothetical protein